jgi:hypothetical protein
LVLKTDIGAAVARPNPLRLKTRSSLANLSAGNLNRRGMRFFRFLLSVGSAAVIVCSAGCSAGVPHEALKSDPTPQDYVERNGGGATVVPAGQLVLDGHRMACGQSATVLDPNLNDYAAAPYPQFIILNLPDLAKAPTAVKLWIYSHECGHLSGGLDENKADCFAVRRGRTEGWLDALGLDQVCGFIGAARADSRHFSGPERCTFMRECFREAAPKPAANSLPGSVSKFQQ